MPSLVALAGRLVPSLTRASFALLALASLTLVAPSRAAACEPLPGSPWAPGVMSSPQADHTDLHWTIGTVGVSALNASVVGLQIAAGREMFPGWAAVAELTLGLAQTGLGAWLFLAGAYGADDSCAPNDPAGPWMSFTGLTLVGMSSWLITHAIWSLIDGDADMNVAGVALHPYAAPVAEGGLVGVLGVF